MVFVYYCGIVLTVIVPCSDTQADPGLCGRKAGSCLSLAGVVAIASHVPGAGPFTALAVRLRPFESGCRREQVVAPSLSLAQQIVVPFRGPVSTRGGRE